MCAEYEPAGPLRTGDPRSPADGLCHVAVVYRTTDDYLAATVPFVLAGLAAEERTLVVSGAERLAALTDALGGDAAQVDARRADTWLTTPWRAAAAFRRYVEEHATDGRRVRIAGEPFACARTPAEAREWTRSEARFNDAFASLPLTALCPYDASALDDQLVAHARCTHPALLDGTGQPRPSDDYADARAVAAALDTAPLAPPPTASVGLTDPPLSVRMPFGELRGFVTAQARAAGLDDIRAADVTFAAHEVAVNAREHGGGDGTLRTWRADGEFVCEIADHGAGMRDPLAGTVEPLPLQPDGRGLWLARQLCDLVQLRSGATGTVVRLHMVLP